MMLGGTPHRTSTATTAPTDARCDRTKPHPPHTYVANPRSEIDIPCPGLAASRSIAQLLADQPYLTTVSALVGVVRHELGVAAA